MVELMMNTEAQTQAPPVERGSRYVVRIGKREGLTRLPSEYYPRYILRNLRWTPIEDASIVQVNTPRALLLFTSHLHPYDADDIRKAFNIFPEVEMYPIVEDVEQGKPYWGSFCVQTFPNRKSTRLPRVAKYLCNYRWVVYEKVGGEKHGILISEIAPHFTADFGSDAYLITASAEEDSVYFHDLTGYNTWFSIPLSHK